MRMAKRGAVDLPTVMASLLVVAVCYSAWLTSIVFCAANGARPPLTAAARRETEM